MLESYALMPGALLLISAYMSITYLLSQAIKNSGIVDIAWASGFTLLSAYYLIAGQHENNTRAWLLAAMISVWSLRLTWHLGTRFLRWYPHEDPRYAELKSKLGSNKMMYVIFLWQGAVLCLMTAPIAVAAVHSSSLIGVMQYCSVFIWLIALLGVSVADVQLTAFTKNPSNKGKTCQVGLWSISRHPNYFFEWMGAVAFSLYVLDLPSGFWTIICPLVLLHLIVNVTGIKPSEEHSLQTRPDYAAYIKSTSPFIPWWRKSTQ